MTWERGWSLRELAPTRRSRVGLGLIVLGVAGVLWGVFHVLGSLPEPGRDFAHRNTDYQDRRAVHGSYFGGLARGLAGVLVAIAGAQLRKRDADRGEPKPRA